MPDIRPIVKEQHNRIDEAVAKFESEISQLIRAVRRDVLNSLGHLEIINGTIQETPDNRAHIRAAVREVMVSAEKNGYGGIANRFLADYQYQTLSIEKVFEELKVPLDWTVKDQELAARIAGADKESLLSAVDDMARYVGQRARMAVGRLGIGDMAELIEGALEHGKSNAVTIADTSMSMFNRKISDAKYKDAGIEKFYYIGPNDNLTRPFCDGLIENGRVFTKDQIDAMDNGQLPNVMATGGGWNCRHLWAGMPYG